jgi:hypothetical protein
MLFLIELGQASAAESTLARLLTEGIPLAAAGLDEAGQMIADRLAAGQDTESWAQLAHLVSILRSAATW